MRYHARKTTGRSLRCGEVAAVQKARGSETAAALARQLDKLTSITHAG